MQDQQPRIDDWRPCSPGTLQRLAAGLRMRQRRRVAVQWAGITTLLLLSAGAGALFAQLHGRQPADLHFGGISCTDVRASIPQFMEHSLSVERERQMREHLSRCPHCQERLRQMGVSMSTSPLPVEQWQAVRAGHRGGPERHDDPDRHGGQLADWGPNSATIAADDR